MKKNGLLVFFLTCILFLATSCAPSSDDHLPPDSSHSETKGEENPSPGITVDLKDYRLIVAADAPQILKDAASELQQTIQQLCGVSLPLLTDGEAGEIPSEAPAILIEPTARSETAEVSSALLPEEYAIRIRSGHIILAGKTEVETVFAVNRFMEMTMGYSANHYRNEPLSGSTVTVREEQAAAETYASGRIIQMAEAIQGTPISPASLHPAGGTVRDQAVHFGGTGRVICREDCGKGSFRIQFRAQIQNDSPTIVQAFLGFSGNAEHLCFSIRDSSVTIARATYERGGAPLPVNSKDFTIRLDVYPQSGRIQYYADGIFLGEMNIDDSDSPISSHASWTLAAVGENIDVDFSELYCEPISDIGPRRYDDPGIVLPEDALYPQSAQAPASTVYVVRAAGLSDEMLLTLATLQGNVNRTVPEIFVDYRSYNQDPRFTDIVQEEAYLDLLRQKGRTLVFSTVEELLERYADRYDGVILGDAFSTVYGENVATSLCGVLNGVYLSEALYGQLRDRLCKDILFRIDRQWESPVDAYLWVWNHYGERFSGNILFHLPSMQENSGHNSRACRDYAVMSRSFVFYTHGVVCAEDYDFYLRLFATRAVNSPVIGFAGGCFPEFEMFRVCGQFAKFWTYGFSTPNMSFFNRLEHGELKQKHPESTAQPEADTVYVSFDLSEGDNLSWNYHLWAHCFADEAKRAAYPKGFSICGALYYVAPALMEYYYDQATVNDYFFLDGGSVSNISSPDAYAVMYRENARDAIVNRMLALTDYVCEKADLSIIRVLWNVSKKMTQRIEQSCPHIQAVFSSYGNNTYAIGGSNHFYYDAIKMSGNLVRCRCDLTTFEPNLAAQLETLCKQAGSGVPIFAEVFVYTNPLLDDFSVLAQYAQELESTGKKIVYVRPNEFCRLYRMYADSKRNLDSGAPLRRKNPVRGGSADIAG